ncbi:MAG: hypothetical protein ABR969_08745 [Sedimentisphaerales bacterium]
MEKRSNTAQKVQVIIFIVFSFTIFLSAQQAFGALPIVSVELTHGNWIYVNGDSINNNNVPCERKWALSMNVESPDTVTGSRVEFHSTRPFTDFGSCPTLFTPPSTYIWDYPDRSLTGPGQSTGFQWIELTEGGFIASPGFTGIRNVNNPLLLDDVTTQIIDFTLKFVHSFEPGINNVSVKLGTFPQSQYIVEESILLQNNVSGWSNNGDGWWSINPNNIVLDTNYIFQAHIGCVKRSQYSGIAVYHKPQAYVQTGEWNNLPGVNGPNTVTIHPEGETAYYQLNESVEWNRSTSLNRQDMSLGMISLPLYDSNPEVNAIELYYGKEYNAAGEYVGHSFSVNVVGRNVIAAEVTTPTGRTWPLEIDEDWIGWDNAEFLTPADLTALGIVEGTYNFAFHGLLGSTITTSVNMTFDTPTQSPNITYPHHWDKDVNIPLTVSWEPVQDTSINTIMIELENENGDWDFYAELPPGQSSCPVSDVPPYDGIYCDVVFANRQTGQTPEGIEWSAYGYSLQSILFTSGTFRGDFDGDEDVDYYDLAAMSDAWLSQPGDFNWNPDCDISEPKDNIINFSDFAVFAQSWLAGTF